MATKTSIQSDLVLMRTDLDMLPDHKAVAELRAELEEWIHVLETQPTEDVAERFEGMDRIHVKLQQVAAILQERDAS